MYKEIALKKGPRRRRRRRGTRGGIRGNTLLQRL